jgi:KEOPS complex subunit Pcc1
VKHHASFSFESPHADLLFRAVRPEADEIGLRSEARVSLEAGRLVLTVDAADIVALRAALNMWLRLINVADEVQSLGRGYRHQKQDRL